VFFGLNVSNTGAVKLAAFVRVFARKVTGLPRLRALTCYDIVRSITIFAREYIGCWPSDIVRNEYFLYSDIAAFSFVFETKGRCCKKFPSPKLFQFNYLVTLKFFIIAFAIFNLFPKKK